MTWNAELKSKYDIGDECFLAGDFKSLVRLVPFSNKDDEDDPTNTLITELLSNDNKKETIEKVDKTRGLFQQVSAIKPPTDLCYSCHHEPIDLDDKFQALGAMVITIAVR